LYKRHQQKPQGKYYRLNHNIPGTEFLVVDAQGEKIGVLSKDEALQKAREAAVDLVEIAPMAKPPVVKIIEFQKFRYEESKKEQAAKKHAKEVELKEIWLTPRIAEHDLMTRLKRVEEFIGNNNKVMFRVKFKGREMAHTNLGFELLRRALEILGDKVGIERDAKLEGRSITLIIGRNRGQNKAQENNNESQTKN
jgi:translation initiation factor IF-3